MADLGALQARIEQLEDRVARIVNLIDRNVPTSGWQTTWMCPNTRYASLCDALQAQLAEDQEHYKRELQKGVVSLGGPRKQGV